LQEIYVDSFMRVDYKNKFIQMGRPQA
jgi:hypothetical protein